MTCTSAGTEKMSYKWKKEGIFVRRCQYSCNLSVSFPDQAVTEARQLHDGKEDISFVLVGFPSSMGIK